MTTVGIYLVVLYAFGIIMNMYYAGQGGVEYTPGVLIFAAIWGIVNLLLILTVGTGSL